MDPLTPDEIERVRALQVSSLCDADKSMRMPDPAIRAMLPGLRMAGPAYPVVAPDDHLPLLVAAGEAPPGSVLVAVNPGGTRAVAGELIATECARRGLAGLVVDGLVRDLRGLREIGLPVFARGTMPASGSAVEPSRGSTVVFGGVKIGPDDVVLGDDDGLAVGTADRIRAALPGGAEVERAERAVLAAMSQGRSLGEMTTLDEHLAALRAGQASALGFRA